MRRQSILRALAFAGVATLTALAGPAAAKDGVSFQWTGFGSGCNGDCAVLTFAGRQTTTSPGMAFGLADVTQGEFGFVQPTPIWAFDWLESGLVGGAVSRQLAILACNGTELLSFEGEIGAAQRFGDMTEAEVWAALYLRWSWFPWNDLIRTTVAASTGLNYATGISDFELKTSRNDEGSNLLHYFSPEVTFALPDRPEHELVFRMHHRSGMSGGDAGGSPGFALFNYADGGSSYATLGFRTRF